MNVVEILL